MNDRAFARAPAVPAAGRGCPPRLRKAVAGLPPDLRGVRAARHPAHPLAAAGAPAHRPVGHPRVLPRTRGTSRRTGRTGTGRPATPRRTPGPGTAASRRSGRTWRPCEELVADPATDLFAPLPHGTGRRSCARPCWWPTTTPTTSASSSCFGEFWGHGTRRTDRLSRLAPTVVRRAGPGPAGPTPATRGAGGGRPGPAPGPLPDRPTPAL